MARKKIQINISGEELKKKLKIQNGKDGKTPIKNVDYFDGEDGISPDPLVVANEASKIVLEEVKKEIPTLSQLEERIPELGEPIVEAINELPTDDDELKIDASHIKNLPKQHQSYGGGGVRNLYQLNDVNVPTPTDGQALVYDSTNQRWEAETIASGLTIDSTTITSGTDTRVLFDDNGVVGEDANFTWNKTTKVLTLGASSLDARLVTHAIKSDASDGLLIEANNGTDVGLLGTGNTANATWYGNHNFDTATANTVAIFGASKTLSSADTTTYPSLTELSYVKGITSAIQTQLDGKQASGSYLQNNVGISGGTTLIGGTASGEDLNLSSTSHATKGSIFLGTSGNSEYDETNRFLTIGNTGSITYTSSTDRLDIIRGGSKITTGFGGFYPLAVFSSTTSGNSDSSIAIIGRSAGTVGFTSSVVFGTLADPDEASIRYDYAADKFNFYIGGNSNPDFTMQGGSNIKFGWSYQGTPATSSKFYIGGAGQGDTKYIELQSGAYGIWAQKLGWDVISNGSGNAKGYLSLSNVVGNTDNVNILKINEERYGFNKSSKICSFDFVTAADDVSEGTTTANASTTITGSSTIFTQQVSIGDRISLSSASSTYATVTAIASDTSLTVDTALGNGTSQTINIKHGMFRVSNSAGTQKFFIDDNGDIFIGYDRSNGLKISSSSSGAITFDAVGSGASITFSDDLIIADAKNVQINTSTGTKIGTGTTQKLGFWNATPIVQPANTVAIDDVLINSGLRASGGSANFSLKITNNLPQNLKGYTVATLPAGVQGDVAYVTDALAPAYLTTVVGGGAIVTPVFYDGTNWVAH